MTTMIKCPGCGKEFEISEALQHQIEEKVRAGERVRQEKEMAEAKKAAEQAALKKADQRYETRLRELTESVAEENAAKKKAQDELLELTREVRKMRQESENAKLEWEKRLAAEEQKIKEATRKAVLDEHDLKDREKDEKLRAALRQVEELKAKIEQGSQQTQGEVLELELEEILRSEFPSDIIEEVRKGQRGADIIQKVADQRGRECGVILWESKNAQWNEGWLKKLREDARAVDAKIQVLVATNLPNDVETFAFRDGVWITGRKFVVGLALALRANLIDVFQQKIAAVGKNEKMEVLYQYLTGSEFGHRVEAIVEGFSSLQEDIEKEKRWFQTKWARQEKEIRRIVDNTQGMYGDLQAVTGRALRPIKILEIGPPTSVESTVGK